MLKDYSKTRAAQQLRFDILAKSREYFAQAWREQPFIPNHDRIPASAKSLDADDLTNLIDASLDLWLTGGRYHTEFEKQFAAWMGQRECILTNSGSSANLLAIMALTSPSLGERALKPGDEIITAACGFPTTVNPIVQAGCVPVFIDSELRTYNADLSQLERAVSYRTRAVVLAHTLGNPFDEQRVRNFCDAHGLWLIADCCDALGATWNGRNVGQLADCTTASFYPAHHLTMGEGGAVLTQSPKLRKIIESFRDWGRDCWCKTGCDNTCGKRYDWDLGGLPPGYDHKFTYAHIGYNLKVTDMQAAIGCSQLKRLDGFISKRLENATRYRDNLREVPWLAHPDFADGCSWFNYPLRVLPGAPMTRDQLVRYLGERRIDTRLLFAGNITRQPSFANVNHIAFGPLENADTIMRDVFCVGTQPSLDLEHIDFACETIANAGRLVSVA